MKQPGSVLELFFFLKKAHSDTLDHLKSRRRSLITAGARSGGFHSQTRFNGSKKEKASRLRDAEWLWRRQPAFPLPRIPRHWSQWSHKLLLTLTVNGYKKTPSFLYMTRSPSLRGFVDRSRGCCEWRGTDGECGGRKRGVVSLGGRCFWDDHQGPVRKLHQSVADFQADVFIILLSILSLKYTTIHDTSKYSVMTSVFNK